MTEELESGRPQNRFYRELFQFHYGAGPYTCYFCKLESAELEQVHHVDGDPWNNSRENLAAAHAFCHNSAHHEGSHHTAEIRKQISESCRRTAASMTAEERSAKWGQLGELNPFYGLTHTEDAKIKISAARKAQPRKWCEDCQRDYDPPNWVRHIRKYHEGGKW